MDALLSLFYTGQITPPSASTASLPATFSTQNPAISRAIASQESRLAALAEEEFRLLSGARQAQSTSQSLSGQLQQIDIQLGVMEKRIREIDEQAAYWQANLDELTSRKDTLRAIYRTAEEEKNRRLTQYLMRQGSGIGADPLLYDWLLGGENLGDILEQQRVQTLAIAAYTDVLTLARTQYDTVEDRQIVALSMLDAASNRQQEAAVQRQVLREMAEAKVTLQQRTAEERERLVAEASSNSQAERAIRSHIAELRDQQRYEATAQAQVIAAQLPLEERIAELESQLSATSTTASQDDLTERFMPEEPLEAITGTVFQSPLPVPLRVTAPYHDAAYQQSFGLVHEGLDLAAPQGTPVMAIADGEVIEVHDGGLGYSYITLAHDNGFYSVYGHLSVLGATVGDSLTAGQALGRSGGTPGTRGAGVYTTGPHLHIELYQGTESVDPLPFLPL